MRRVSAAECRGGDWKDGSRRSRKASRRVTEDEEVVGYVGNVAARRRARARASAIRFINNYSLCTRENYSLYPP